MGTFVRVSRGAGGLAALLALVLLAVSAGGRGPSPAVAATSTAPCGGVAPSTAAYAHVVVIMDENLSVPQWQATTDSPYTHLLAKRCRLLSNAAGETHPSFPNYMAVASGTFPTPACLGCPSSADNIFHQLNVAGHAWRDYNQSMPRNCAPNTGTVPQYRDNHNPARWFTDLGPNGDNTCATRDVPLDPFFWNDLAANNLRAFSWIAPDDCHNMHWRSPVCESETGGTKTDRIKIGDAFIKSVVRRSRRRPTTRPGRP